MRTDVTLVTQIIALLALLGVGIGIGYAGATDLPDGAYTITPVTIDRTPLPSRCGERCGEGRADR